MVTQKAYDDFYRLFQNNDVIQSDNDLFKNYSDILNEKSYD